MKVKINNGKASSIHLDGVFYDTNKEIEVSFSEALRLKRLADVTFVDDKAPYNPELFHKDKRFAFQADVDVVSGWGNVGLNLIKYSADEYDISQIGRLLNVTEPSVLQAARRELDPAMGVVIHEQPKAEWLYSPFDRKIAVVPFETTIIPKSWITRINSCTALLVPCKQNMEAFRDSGVTVPIELIHWGIDPAKFYELEREDDGVFTIGTMGALSKRKGTDMLIEAFLKAFPVEKDVKLLCKTSNYNFIGAVKDKRVQIEMTPVDHQDLLNGFFKKVDMFAFPTRGEGFGLTPLEALATGIPAVVTNWSGPVEYMNNDVGWMLDYHLVEAEDFTKNVYREECGQWAEPDFDHLVHILRWAYEHQDEVKAMGKRAAEHVRTNWLWKDKIRMYHEALEKHL